MRPRTSSIFPVALIAMLAALTFWLERLVQGPDGPPVPRDPGTPDFVIDNLKGTKMNPDGHAEYTLAATRMVHFPASDTTEVEQPRLVQWRADAPPVRVSAVRGTVSGDGKELHLQGDVVIVRDKAPGRGELRVETNYLEVIPDAEIARTPEHVVITQDGSRLEGVGMVFDNKARELELRSLVSGTYRPLPAKTP
ncbi:MAG: LPS export ABC transporter periplasmic protein LptC [Betaproteobacteria bacterium]|nr:LPS export ABC transporter periplasmic protein LptC [Betaproteobacteria bacterium]